MVMMSLRIVVDMFVNMDEFLKDSKGAQVTAVQRLQNVATYYGYNSLVYITELGGVIIVASAGFTLARMNHTNELTAMMASGVSLRRVVLPIILCAIGLDVLILINQEYVIPSPAVAGNLLRKREGDLPGKKTFPVRVMVDGSGTVWSSRNLVASRKEMEKPFALIRDSKLMLVGIIAGDVSCEDEVNEQPGWSFAGVSEKTPAYLRRMGGSWPETPDTNRIYTYASPDGLLKSLAQEVQKMGRPAGDVEKLTGAEKRSARDERYGLTINYGEFIADAPHANEPRGGTLKKPQFIFQGDSAQVLGIFTADSAKWVQQRVDRGYWKLVNGRLFYPSDLKVEEMALRQTSRWLDYMSTSDLAELIKLKKVPDMAAAQLARNTRFTDPINNLIMLLLGLPFILSRERNIKASASLCLLMVATFMVFIYLCRYVNIEPHLAAWLPILLFGPIAVVMLDSVKT